MSNYKVFNSEEDLKDAFESKTIRVLRIGDTKLCVGQFEGTFFAFEHLCPHQKQPLKDGQITSFGEVVCPLHEYRFDLKTGKEANQKCQAMRTYPLQITSEGVYLEV